MSGLETFSAVDLACAQLERMRTMHYHYHRKFFSGLFLFSGIFLILWLFGGRWGCLWIPFLVVTAGVQSSFYLHFCDFARVHAANLEKWINRSLGRKMLCGHEIEDLYFYPLGKPKISGFSLNKPNSAFSFFTIHWTLLWSGVALAALWHGFGILPQRFQIAYLAVLTLWAAGNIAFLSWYFLKGSDLKKVDETLKENLGGNL